MSEERSLEDNYMDCFCMIVDEKGELILDPDVWGKVIASDGSDMLDFDFEMMDFIDEVGSCEFLNHGRPSRLIAWKQFKIAIGEGRVRCGKDSEFREYL